MKIVYRYIPPATVLYARAIGPYATGTVEAWRTLSHWLNAQNARSCMRVSYGLFRDNPRRTPAEILRYDACVPLGIGLEEDPAAGIQRQTLLGGTFGVHTHIGGFETTGQLFSRLYREEIPARGLKVDEDRPFLAIYLTDPAVTREQFQRTELCVPVFPVPALSADNDHKMATDRTSHSIRATA